MVYWFGSQISFMANSVSVWLFLTSAAHAFLHQRVKKGNERKDVELTFFSLSSEDRLMRGENLGFCVGINYV